jgi:SulP family sulfate permease
MIPPLMAYRERIAMVAHAQAPSFVELFTPKLVTILRERYRLADLKADIVAGLTVAIVALPLSMAIAIA